jgi:hypothetical protein
MTILDRRLFVLPSPQRRRIEDEVAGYGATTDLTPALSCKAREKVRVRDSSGKPAGGTTRT